MANDVMITLINNTNEDTFGLIFQQDPDLDKIFVDVFPTAWENFPLSKGGGQGQAKLPVQYQIDGGDTSNVFKGTVSLPKDTDLQATWDLTQTDAGFYELTQTGKSADQSIICVNDSATFASISLCKNSKPLLTYPKVGQGAQATFLPLSFIYVAWFSDLVVGSKILASISTPQAVGINLDGAETIVATLTENPNTGRKTWDIQVNGHPVSMLVTAAGLHKALSVTERLAA